jgi:hypothetical protein
MAPRGAPDRLPSARNTKTGEDRSRLAKTRSGLVHESRTGENRARPAPESENSYILSGTSHYFVCLLRRERHNA